MSGKPRRPPIVVRPVIVTEVKPMSDGEDLFSVTLRGTEGMSVELMVRASEVEQWFGHRDQQTRLDVQIVYAARKPWTL